MRKITILLLGFLCSTISLAQTEKKISYRFEKMDISHNKGHSKANFLVEYIFTDENPLGDRYSQSITITDSIATLNFVIPDFKTHDYALQEKRLKLQPEELDSLKWAIKKANLKQLKSGIARPHGDMYTREILIIKYDNIQIAGGQTYRSLATHLMDGTPDDQIEKEIAKDRRNSSSVGGDYDSIINILAKYFKNIEGLRKDLP